MHEHSLVAGLIKKIDTLLKEQGGRRVIEVTVRLGALSNISAGHFREHFFHATQGTPLAGVLLTVKEDGNARDPFAQEIVLESLEVVN